AQTLRADIGHRDVREQAPTAATLREIASLTIEVFGDHRLQLFPCEPLHRDLRKLRVEERSSGTSWRLVSPRDGDGHGDSFSAFSLALLIASELSGEETVDQLDHWFDDENSLDGFSARQQAWEAEQRMLDRPDTASDALRDALRRGDVHVFGPENPFF